MNQSWLPRRPAFSGLWPTTQNFKKVEAKVAAWIQNATGLHGEVMRLPTNSTPPYGHYRVLGHDRAFVKVLSSVEACHHVKADSIAEDAFLAGASTLPAMRWIQDTETIRIGIYPYIDGRLGELSKADATHLGGALASLHEALRSSEKTETIRHTSTQRMKMLESRRQQILNGYGAMGPFPDKLQNLMAEHDNAFNLVDEGQIIHGDLNPGNILFSKRNGQPIFIDFESATVSWFPIEIDVAMVLQRLALVPAGDSGQAVSYGQALLKAYILHSSLQSTFTSEDLMKAMVWLSVRNLALLAELESQGRRVEESEWSKFFMLLELSKESSDVLDSVTKSFDKQ